MTDWLRDIRFWVGILVGGGAVLTGVIVGDRVFEDPIHSRMYDHCLIGGNSKQACDAMMREVRRAEREEKAK